MMLHGQWIDFVNLRSESYDVDSRIPDKVVGGRARFAQDLCYTLPATHAGPAHARIDAEADVGVWDAGAGRPAARHYDQRALLQPHDGPGGRLHQDGRRAGPRSP